MRLGDGVGAGVQSLLRAGVVPGAGLRRRERVRCRHVDDHPVPEDRVDAGEPSVDDLRVDTHLSDPTGDVGQVLFGRAAHVQLGQVAVRAVGGSQLDWPISGAEHAVGGPQHASSLPELGQFVGVGDTELDVEQSVERHQRSSPW